MTTGPTLVASKPRRLFERAFSSVGYDITPDGQRFLMVQDPEEKPVRLMQVVLNWTEELKRLAPAGRN